MFTIKIIIALNLRTPIPIPSDKHLRFTGPFRVPTYPPGLPGSLCHKELFDPSFWLQGPSPFIPRESWIQSLSPVFHSGGGSQSISNRRVTLKACWSTWIPEGVQAASLSSFTRSRCTKGVGRTLGSQSPCPPAHREGDRESPPPVEYLLHSHCSATPSLPRLRLGEAGKEAGVEAG